MDPLQGYGVHNLRATAAPALWLAGASGGGQGVVLKIIFTIKRQFSFASQA